MSVDELLSALRSEGRRVETGRFDLDAARAREKLARYQLVDPYRYVLQFVQAAVLLGAERIDVEVDSDEVEFHFGGGVFGREDLEDVYLHAFADRSEAHGRALRHLATGIIAAGSLDPARLIVESEPGEARLRLTVAREDETVEEIDPTDDSRTRLYVRERLRPRHVIEFFRRFRRPGVVEVTLEDARYCEVELVVNGRPESVGIQRPRFAERIETPLDHGYVVVDPRNKSNGRLTLVQNGVRVEDAPLDVGDIPVTGVVASKGLTTNLSHSAFVRNGAFRDLMDEVVLPAVFRACLRYVSRVVSPNRAVAVAMFNAALRTRVRLQSRHREVPPSIDRLCMALGDEPIWRRMRSEHGDELAMSTRELLAEIGEGPVPVSQEEYRGIVLRDERGEPYRHIVQTSRRGLVREADPGSFAAATGRELIDLTERLQQEHQVRTGSHRFRSERTRDLGLTGGWPPRLNHWDYHEPVTLSRGGFQASIAIPIVAIAEASRLFAIPAYGERMDPEDPAITVLRGFTIVVAPRSEDDERTADRVRLDGAPAVCEAAMTMLVAPEHPLPPSAVRRLTRHVLGGTLAETICADMGHGEAAASVAEAAAHGEAWLQCLLAADDGSTLTERLEALGDAASNPMFARVRGGHLSLAQATAAPVKTIDAKSRQRALQIRYELELVEDADPVIWLDEDGRQVLEGLVGVEGIVEYEESLGAEALRIERLRGGLEEDPRLNGVFTLKRLLTGDGLTGELGLSSVDGDAGIEMVVLHDGKRIARRVLPCSFGRFRAIVQSGHVTPTRDLGDVVENDEFHHLCGRLQEVAAEMFEMWCQERITSSEPLADFEELAIWRAIVESAETDEHTHRLDWPVFDLVGGDAVSVRRLRQNAGESIELVTGGRAESAGTAIQLPVAPGPRLQLLARLLPDANFTHVSPTIRASTEFERAAESTTTARPERQTRNDDQALGGLPVLLAAAGVTEITLLDGPAPPALAADVARLQRDHPLVSRLPDDSAAEYLVALVVVAHAPQRLAEACRVFVERSQRSSE